jgi:hypothetical protein
LDRKELLEDDPRRKFLAALTEMLTRPGGDDDVADLSELVASLAPFKPELINGRMQDASDALLAIMDCVNDGEARAHICLSPNSQSLGFSL